MKAILRCADNKIVVFFCSINNWHQRLVIFCLFVELFGFIVIIIIIAIGSYRSFESSISSIKRNTKTERAAGLNDCRVIAFVFIFLIKTGYISIAVERKNNLFLCRRYRSQSWLFIFCFVLFSTFI